MLTYELIKQMFKLISTYKGRTLVEVRYAGYTNTYRYNYSLIEKIDIANAEYVAIKCYKKKDVVSAYAILKERG